MPEKIAPPRWLKPLNTVLLLGRRLGLGWTRELPVLTLPGRRTGKLRRTPVSGDPRGPGAQITEGAKIMRDAGVVPDLEPDSFAALAGRCAAFRIEPE